MTTSGEGHGGSAQSHCIFCDIIQGAAEVSVCYEDLDAMAFMDIQPVNQGHVLVVPRQHVAKFSDVPSELALHLFDVAQRLSSVVERVSKAEGLNIIVSSGAAAGQDVFHFHIHLIPRMNGDGFDVPLPFAASSMPDRSHLDAMAARIISALRDPARSKSGSHPAIAANRRGDADAVTGKRD
ncbi:MAG: HIT family protein [Gemmatimonadota bacterium]|nr:HIT family protein [Gemmatimonadota bacterium]